MKPSPLIFLTTPRKKGFTLIEILVVGVIFSILSLMLFTVFKSAMDSWRRGESQLEIYENARIAVESITNDLRAAMLDPANTNITFRGFDSAAPSGWRTNNIGDEMYFIATLNPDTTTAWSDLCKVGYWLDGKGTGDTKDDTLEKIYMTQLASSFNPAFGAGDTTRRLAPYVTQLNFRYWDPTIPGFIDTWNSSPGAAQANRLPRMVEITITVRESNPIDPTSPKTQQFVTNVYIPRSQQQIF